MSRRRISKNPKFTMMRYVKEDKDPTFLEKIFINAEIGFGVFTTQDIDKGDFVAEYVGELISKDDGEKRLKEDPENNRSFLYFFKHKGQSLCLDATQYTPRIGRYFNDSKNSNCNVKLHEIDGRPHLCLFTNKDISKGSELRYNYIPFGGSQLPWRGNNGNLMHKEIRNCLHIDDLKITEYVHDTVSVLVNKVEYDGYKIEVGPCLESLLDMVVAEEEQEKRRKIYEEERVIANVESAVPDTSESKQLVPSETNVITDQIFKSIIDIVEHDFSIKIGEGTCGTIYQIKRENRSAALKVFKNPLSQRKIKKIASNLCSIDHVNVLKCYGYSSKPCALVFEFCSYHVDGESINNVSQLLEIWGEMENFSFQQRAQIVLQSCEGLQALHDRRIVHRDFKPANLLVKECAHDKFVIKVCDFDELFELTTKTLSTKTCREPLAGCTVAYTAPEICLNSAQSSIATDIYSFALSCYEVLSGISPPWSQVLPRINDIFIFEALKEKKRPHTEIIKERYADMVLDEVVSAIKNMWHSESNQRMSLNLFVQILNSCKENVNVTSVSKQDEKNLFPSPYKELQKNEKTEQHNDKIEKFVVKVKGRKEKQKINKEEEVVEKVEGDQVRNQKEKINKEAEVVVKVEDRKEKQKINKEEEVVEEVQHQQDRIAANGAYKGAGNFDDDDFDVLPRICGEEKLLHVQTMKPNDYMDFTCHYSRQVDEELQKNEKNEQQNDKIEKFVVKVEDRKEKQNINKEEEVVEKVEGDQDRNQKQKINKEAEVVVKVKDRKEKQKINKEAEVMEEVDDAEGDKTQEALKKEETNEKNEVKTMEKKGTKPHRPCPYCGVFQSCLTNHLKKVHQNEDKVKKALQLSAKSQRHMFAQLKKDGIREYNIEEVKKKNPKLQHERLNKKKSLTYEDFTMCSSCGGFYTKVSYRKHKLSCQSEVKPHSISISQIELSIREKLSYDFTSNVLATLRCDEIGNFIRENHLILLFGSFQYDKVKRKENKKIAVIQSVRNDMRKIAYLYQTFLQDKTSKKIHNNIKDLFLTDNFYAFKTAVLRYTTSEDGKTLKAGLKHNLLFCIKQLLVALKGTALMSKDNEYVQELDGFDSILKLFKDDVFGDATYKLNSDRLVRLRKPQAMPLEDDLRKLRRYIIMTFKNLLAISLTELSQSDFILLRNVLCARLTLYNARRGGEPARMTLIQAQEALNRDWEPQDSLSKIDPLSGKAERKMITFQEGKGNKSCVGVIIPEDCIPPLKRIISPLCREKAGISKGNKYLFASIKKSNRHVVGWKAIHIACTKAGVESIKNMTATTNRHRTSTLFASLEVPLADREKFYNHMGHSAEINKQVYQAPAAVAELNRVAKHLDEIDKGCDSDSENCLFEDSTSIQDLPASNQVESEKVISSNDRFQDLPASNQVESEKVISSNDRFQDLPASNQVESEKVISSNDRFQGNPSVKSKTFPQVVVSPRSSCHQHSKNPRAKVLSFESDEEEHQPSERSYRLRLRKDTKKQISYGNDHLDPDLSEASDDDDDDDDDEDFDPMVFQEDQSNINKRSYQQMKSGENFQTFLDSQKRKWLEEYQQQVGSSCKLKKSAASSCTQVRKDQVSTSPKEKMPKLTQSSSMDQTVASTGRKYCTWTPRRSALFFTHFGKYIHGDRSNQFPSSSEMMQFIEESGISFNKHTVRTKVVNEKDKHKRLVARRQTSLGFFE